ncbi:hypothetical protein Tco_1183791 [Tanacetum coccineum]
MDIFTKGALRDYWKMGGDEIEVSDDESSDLEEYWCGKEETAEIFKIDTDVFDYETPLYLAFNEFNYLLKVDPNLLTKDFMGFKTYEDYKDNLIYEWNKDIPWVNEKPGTDTGVWSKPKPIKHTCKPFNYKTGYLEWPTCSRRKDGYCNRGNFPGAYHIGNLLHYQDLEWYEALEDSELKNEALKNKAIMEGLISDDESNNDCWKRWKSHEIYYHDYDEGEYENKTHEEGHELCGIKTRESSAYKLHFLISPSVEYVVSNLDFWLELVPFSLLVSRDMVLEHCEFINQAYLVIGHLGDLSSCDLVDLLFRHALYHSDLLT